MSWSNFYFLEEEFWIKTAGSLQCSICQNKPLPFSICSRLHSPPHPHPLLLGTAPPPISISVCLITVYMWMHMNTHKYEQGRERDESWLHLHHSVIIKLLLAEHENCLLRKAMCLKSREIKPLCVACEPWWWFETWGDWQRICVWQWLRLYELIQNSD